MGCKLLIAFYALPSILVMEVELKHKLVPPSSQEKLFKSLSTFQGSRSITVRESPTISMSTLLSLLEDPPSPMFSLLTKITQLILSVIPLLYFVKHAHKTFTIIGVNQDNNYLVIPPHLQSFPLKLALLIKTGCFLALVPSTRVGPMIEHLVWTQLITII